MPRLLKNQTCQCLEVAQQSLRHAFHLLSTPRPISFERRPSDGAIEMGLVGVAAELTLVACLNEILGKQSLIRPDTGFYITASEALDKFRTALVGSTANLTALTSGTANPATHLTKLHKATDGFTVILTARACALHAGSGTSHDIAFAAGKTVTDFLGALAESTKWKPYLRETPVVPTLPKERALIAQDIANALKSNKTTTAAAALGVFLVLPELTPTEPEWLQSLQHAQVTPRANDITVLVKSLQVGKVGELFKVGKGAASVPVRIAPDDPNALPISTTGFKKKFEQTIDQWSAYIGTANADLDRNVLSVPPRQSLYRFAAVGMTNIGIPSEELTALQAAHSVWPYVAAALNNRTPGPFFFVLKTMKPDQLGQLEKLLANAAKAKPGLKAPLAAFLPLIRAAVEAKPVSLDVPAAKVLSTECAKRMDRHTKIDDQLKARRDRAIGADRSALDVLISLVEDVDSIAVPLGKVATGEIKLSTINILPVTRVLVGACSDQEDLKVLAEIESKSEFAGVHTEVRKAIHEIDYKYFGPQAQ